jgi:predicted transcriptional regulator of viral defense system
MSLSEKKRMLLFKGAQTGGKVSITMAENLYSSKSGAKSAITSLEFQGYLERDVPGFFEIKKLPRDVKERLQEIQEEKGSENDSEFQEEPVS